MTRSARTLAALICAALTTQGIGQERVLRPQNHEFIATGAQQVVERTRTTTATYAVYLWGGSIDRAGKIEDHWSAEFHAGDWHRMEGPDSRVVANCRTRIGYVYDVKTGMTAAAPNAYRGACGIFDPGNVTSTERLSGFGDKQRSLDFVILSDPNFVRRYVIDNRGAILESLWSAADGTTRPCIWTKALADEDTLPSTNMFTDASLTQSFVPAKYLVRPTGFDEQRLFGVTCATR